MFLRWSLASQQIMGDGYIHRAFRRLSRPVHRYFGGLLLPSVCYFAGWPGFSQQPVHHWHFLYSNRRAVLTHICFQSLKGGQCGRLFRFQ
jgi:hypothetical protein